MAHGDLDTFALDLENEIRAEASIDDREKFTEQVFTERMLDYLHEATVLENGVSCCLKATGMKIDGYDINIEENTIVLLVSHFVNYSSLPVPKVGKTDVDTAFKRAQTFLSRGRDGLHEKMEESVEAWDVARLLHEHREIDRARIILITDGVTGSIPVRREQVDGVDVTFQAWDMERLYRFVTSGMKREQVNVNFRSEFGSPLDCLRVCDKSQTYTTYLAVITGEMLAALYHKWGTRILERNVRAFLQARGKVNKGIRGTIVSEPNMFLAYNNGITVTASAVEAEMPANGKCAIISAADFQIVNGGQTIASLWHAKTKDKASLADIAVQMKLTVMTDSARTEQVAPLISKYSNTQNKVNTADFQANDPFHIALEQLSRTVWAPDSKGGNVQTRWFYERARGAYDETRNQERTPARIRAWDAAHPRKQKFDKLMLAKIEKTWSLQPYWVSRGAEKNFADFSIDLKEQKRTEPTQDYFLKLVARLIIWKEAERIVQAQGIPGYRANVVTYTLSWLVHMVQNRLDLNAVWQNQAVGSKVRTAIEELSAKAREHILNTDLNVTEWCKKDDCWEELKKKTATLPTGVESELIDTSMPTLVTDHREPNDEEKEMINWVVGVEPEVWKNISRWGSQTKLLASWENSICYSVGRLLSNGKRPSPKQARQSKRIYEKATGLGYQPTP